MQQFTCHITGEKLPISELYQGAGLRKSLLELIQADYPDFTAQSYISIEALNKYRKKYLEAIIQSERGELSRLEQEVIQAISKDQFLSGNLELNTSENLTLGQQLADRIASFGGSWTFILCFFSFLLLWMAVNVFVLVQKPFDPYPFILLNLILSCLAAIQAPIIMMSQNRQEQKDRQRSEYDYKVNLKAELEIRLLHEKIDHLIVHQNQRLLEIQQIQTDYMEDILKELKNVSLSNNSTSS
ncbi:MAG: DUF1003 domain-containing protein [Saprospiraceae bacterium]